MRRATMVAAATAVALAGCASIPTSGPVEEGDAELAPVAPLVPILEGPRPTDGPAAIVTGFLTASASGVATTFDVAREFLTDEAASTWNPTAQTLVYDSGGVTPEWNVATSTVSYPVPLASTIDDSGRRLDAADDAVAPLEFELSQSEDGQWRISELADGVVMSQASFDRFFRAVDLVFATADLTTAVPELRWLPDNNIATSAARELIEGPSPWLADAVVTGFPAAAGLAVQSVVVEEGVATVDVTAQSAGTPEQRSLAQAQMEAMLTALPTVSRVEVLSGGLPIATAGEIELAPAPVPEVEAAAFVGRRLGTWNGDSLTATDPALGGVSAGAEGLARAYAGGAVAFVDSGNLLATDVLGQQPTVPVDPDAEPAPVESALDTTMLLDGDDLVSPSFDRHGYVWTAESVGTRGLAAIAPDGTVSWLATEWIQTRSITDLAVSREGTRVAVVSRAGGQPVVEVAAIVRDGNGVPTAIADPIVVGSGVGAAVEVEWSDDTTVGVLGEVQEGAPTTLWLVEVGGGTRPIQTIRDAVDFAARAGETSILVVASDGHAEERSGSTWVPVVEGVSELAYSG
ncbi:LpqB family beta-propeller domain-containing protein [Demequina sp. NBRC 110053]|uniref:LpqB family beta-propeller domain-containing protein n=1 Tax=Demequina sp. NBRC 110053 TaxID=1570342 RepID=UPI000A05EC4A|nr:LpqB family beta-propeller domain-containing protein [Demequina sp. NBRC 110053]